MSVPDRLASALVDRYRLERELGAGGMATVYLAHDRKHARHVAVKVLHPDLAAALGGERFLAEIRTTANLQHPHILPLHDSGESDGFLFYVMPYVEGESLRDRLDRERQLPIDAAVRLAQQVASALDYAHRRGVIHRDIKPENILLHEGTALVADFGIALAVQSAGGTRMTQTGLSLGTPQYMSPEQAMGDKAIDARSDVYSLAAVTYEMLVGQPPFTGATTQAIVAKVIASDPEPVSVTRRNVAPGTAAAVQRGLQKVPADRYQTAAEFGTALLSADAPGPVVTATVAAPSKPRRTRQALTIAFAAIGAAAIFALGRVSQRGSELAVESMMVTLAPEPGEQWQYGGNSFAVSPDGRRIVVTSGNSLAIRSLDSLSSQPLPGTRGATLPFWSPDGLSIGFFADKQLKTIRVSSGAIRALCSTALPQGGSWNASGTILFQGERGGALSTVSAGGGACAKLAIAMPPDNAGAALRPYFFPDGRHFIVTSDLAVFLGELNGDSLRKLTSLPRLRALLGAPDYLIYRPVGSPGGSIFAQRIDVASATLVDDPVKILENVPNPGGSTSLSVADNGVLVARIAQGANNVQVAATIARDGRVQDTTSLSGTFGDWRLSRDGRRIAQGGFQLKILDLSTHVSNRIQGGGGNAILSQYPVWSPRDTAIAFSRRDSAQAVSIVAINVQSGALHTITTEPTAGRVMRTTDWSADGRFIAYSRAPDATSTYAEGWVVDVASGQSRRLFDERADIGKILFSPSGRLVAYQADDGVFVRSFPAAGLPVRVSQDPASLYAWRSDGRELYLDMNGAIMAVSVREDGTVSSSPQVVISADAVRALAPGFLGLEPSLDARLFHVTYEKTINREGLTLVTNWPRRTGIKR